MILVFFLKSYLVNKGSTLLLIMRGKLMGVVADMTYKASEKSAILNSLVY